MAVYDAFIKSPMALNHIQDDRNAIAAALRAAVEVVVPEKDTTSSPCREHCVIGSAPERIRRELLNIATELEGVGDGH